MKDKIAFVGKSVALLLVGALVGLLLLVIAYQIPVHTTNRNIAYELDPQRGEYPRVSELGSPYVYYFEYFFPDILDGGSDTVILQTALDTSEGNPLVRAMTSHSDSFGDYNWYWHGYVSILRPLMRVFGLSELRIFNSIFHIILLVVCVSLIYAKKGWRYCIMFLCSYIFLMPIALMMSLQYAAVFYITFIGLVVLFLTQNTLLYGNKYLYYFILLGMCTSYLDLLTYPLITWGFPIVWMLVIDETHRKATDWLKRVICSGCSWIFGYAGMWLMKWILAFLILGDNVFRKAVNEVFLWSGVVLEDWTSGVGERVEAIYANWRHYEYKVYFLIIFIWLGWWLFQNFSKGKWIYSDKKYAYYLIGLSSIVWYVVVANHTRIHHFFTYRIFGVTLLAAMALMLDSVSQDYKKKMLLVDRTRFAGAVLGVTLLSALLAVTAREELYVTNGGAEFASIKLDDNESIEFSFAPAYSDITKLGFGLQSAGEEGEYQITLWDGENQLETEKYPIVKSKGKNYCEIDVSWDLDCDKVYRVTVEAIGNSEPVFAWVTEGTEQVLGECGKVNIGKANLEGQFLLGITYMSYPRSITRLIFLTGSWLGVLMITMYVAQRKQGSEIRTLG